MYCATSSLPHLLPPEAYASGAHYEREVRSLLGAAWHLVATTQQLARPGDFVTCELLDRPIQVRNFAGELKALSNVCSHRHCLLTSLRSGSTPGMRCQYHGWEYGPDGRTRRIPEAKLFSPLDRDVHRLEEYRVACCGQLVFVSLATGGPSLADQLGDFAELCAGRFGPDWVESLNWESEYSANWKVPIENSLEAYHVPCIHAGTFREDPGPLRSKHLLLPHRTAFATTLPFSPHSTIDRWFQTGEGWLVKRLGVSPTGEYWQHHVFPNLLFSFTDAVSLCQCVTPAGVSSSRGRVVQFGRTQPTASMVTRGVARIWGWIAAGITQRILREDMALFGDIQRGLTASRQRGLLGSCEERIHSFQQHVADRCGIPCGSESADCSPAESATRLGIVGAEEARR